MSEIRKKAMTRLMLCAVALVACIIFSVLLLSGTFDGKTGGSKPASGDTISSSAPAEGVDDPTADNFTAESTPAEEAPAEPEATPRADAGAHARARVRGPERAAHHLL